MYFKLASTSGKQIGYAILSIIMFIMISPVLIYSLKEILKLDIIMSAIISLILVLASAAFIIIYTLNQNKKSWPMDLEVDNISKRLKVIYSNQNKKLFLNFDDIENIELDIVERTSSNYSTYLAVKIFIKTKNQQCITYDYDKKMLVLLKAIVYLRKYFKITYTPGSEKYVDKWINNYEEKGDFGYTTARLRTQIFSLIIVLTIVAVMIFSISPNGDLLKFIFLCFSKTLNN